MVAAISPFLTAASASAWLMLTSSTETDNSPKTSRAEICVLDPGSEKFTFLPLRSSSFLMLRPATTCISSGYRRVM